MKEKKTRNKKQEWENISHSNICAWLQLYLNFQSRYYRTRQTLHCSATGLCMLSTQNRWYNRIVTLQQVVLQIHCTIISHWSDTEQSTHIWHTVPLMQVMFVDKTHIMADCIWFVFLLWFFINISSTSMVDNNLKKDKFSWIKNIAFFFIGTHRYQVTTGYCRKIWIITHTVYVMYENEKC